MPAPRRPRPHPPAPAATPKALGFSFPAEWTRHRGTWISWPRPEGISFPARYRDSIEDVIRVIGTIAQF
jgi:agmatine deiminase